MTMSANARIAALEAAVAALTQRVLELEGAAAAIQSGGKVNVEPQHVPAIPSPIVPPRQILLSVQPAPAPAPVEAAGENFESILFDPNVANPRPNRIENKHIMFIQTLFFVEKKSKDEIVNRTLENFPELYKEQGPRGTAEYREAMVCSSVDLHTSKWSPKLVKIV